VGEKQQTLRFNGKGRASRAARFHPAVFYLPANDNPPPARQWIVWLALIIGLVSGLIFSLHPIG